MGTKAVLPTDIEDAALCGPPLIDMAPYSEDAKAMGHRLQPQSPVVSTKKSSFRMPSPGGSRRPSCAEQRHEESIRGSIVLQRFGYGLADISSPTEFQKAASNLGSLAGGDLASSHRGLERGMISLRLICIGYGELPHRRVETVA